jgi:enterochelin esterase-like enzyme/GNAT superfamily N-acetyltransferase
MKIISGCLDNPQVQALLEHHVRTARSETALGSAHALDLEGLRSANVTFWSAWEGERLLGVGALRQLSPLHGEIKSMHTVRAHRREGVGTAILRQIIAAARAMGITRLSLETGSSAYFDPARSLYRSRGFVECPPFGDYVADHNSIFMTLELGRTAERLTDVSRIDTLTEEHVVASADGKYTRTVWLLRSPSESHHQLAVFLDAEHYLRDLKAMPIIEGLLQSWALPPTTCVFVSHVNGAARHEDYTCNNDYTHFIIEDVVGWARGQDRQVQFEDNLVCGLSLSGLAAAYIASRAPRVFTKALCQSGSFWWLADHPRSLPASRGRFWLSVGSDETASGVSHPPTGLFQRVSQIDGVRAMAKRLSAEGATVNFRVFAGGHGPMLWREELSPALTWLCERRTA